MKCNVVCIQTYPIMNNKETNLTKMAELLEQALAEKPDTQLVVFPELATTGYQCGENFQELAEEINESSHTVRFFSDLAKKHGVYIIWGMAEKDSKNKKVLYNSQVFLDCKGEIIGTYRKIHLFDTEKNWFTPGKEYKVYNTAIGKIGLFVCYDAFFPEAARIMAVKGADLLVNSTNWEKPYSNDMDLLMSARALENAVYLACCNRIGKDLDVDFFGHTRILDTLGNIISDVKEEKEDFIYASLDYDKKENLKKTYYTMLSERRPELYTELCK